MGFRVNDSRDEPGSGDWVYWGACAAGEAISVWRCKKERERSSSGLFCIADEEGPELGVEGGAGEEAGIL